MNGLGSLINGTVNAENWINNQKLGHASQLLVVPLWLAH
jgi:hypothetical protein